MTPSVADTARYRTEYWDLAGGDQAYRFAYALTPDSIVIDAGGYRGDWAAGIRARYGCRIYIFEPMPAFYESIVRRFAGDPLIKVFPFGLAGEDKTVSMAMANENTSGLRPAEGDALPVSLRRFTAVCQEECLTRIDLLKVNIEGGEYELLEHLVATKFIASILNLQVQFHDFVPDAEKRKQALRALLAETHYPTYLFDFVWENWRLLPHAGTVNPVLELTQQLVIHEYRAIALLRELQQQQATMEKVRQQQLAINDFRNTSAYKLVSWLIKIFAFLPFKGRSSTR